MSRRDTIIVAVLINAGLLIILFVSALKNGDDSSTGVVAEKSQYAANTEARSDAKVDIGDEVDQVLSQYAKQIPIPEPLAMDNVDAVAAKALADTTAKEEPISQQNFVNDLTAFAGAPTTAEVPPKISDAAPDYIDVIVKKGDVLEKIAKQHKTSVAQIMKINKLSNSSLKIGQTLKVPAKAQLQQEEMAAKTSSTETDAKYYIVKAGDNPWTIAVKNHIKVDDLLRLNNMDEARARKLKPGDKIRIR